MDYTLRKGTRAKLLLLTACDLSAAQAGKTGLDASAAGASAAYIREGDARARAIRLVRGTLGAHHPGSFVEVDAQLLPGVYQFAIPDEVLAAGADSAVLVFQFPGARVEPITISLVAYDPQDANRIGMSALGPEGRIAALRGAFPRLTAKELEGR
jgi:hypothetical protein